MATTALPIIPSLTGEELSLPADIDFQPLNPLSRIALRRYLAANFQLRVNLFLNQ